MALSDFIPGRVYSRSDCGLPSSPGGSRRALSSVTQYVVHHTTGNALGHTDNRRWWRSIRNFHVNQRGWADIGYNYGVDRFGNVYVGRGRHRVGAHAPGANHSGLGVAYMGDSGQHLTPEAQRALRGLYRWARTEGNLPLREIMGHGDVPGNSTSCPGNGLRGWVRNGMPSVSGSTATAPSQSRVLSLESPMLRGDDVQTLQRKLAKAGFSPGSADGIFGPATAKAASDFWHSHSGDRISPSSIRVGPRVREALEAAVEQTKNPEWDLHVAVTANNPVDEGMARVLGRFYGWRYLDAHGYDGAAEQTDGLAVKHIVRVGAVAGQDVDDLRLTHHDEVFDIVGQDRHHTAGDVADRIESDTGTTRDASE